ncbi:hypothetical protein [Nostoc commune]|uniref:hypothetical protein n=1 Tax=Nostoc commune TaxID=1178 RepID=UPI002B200C9E|nr:hypothetical protein [Nostoc commune]
MTAEPGFQTLQLPLGSEYLIRTWVRQVTIPIFEDKRLIGYFQAAVPMNSLRVNLNQARLFLTFGVPVTFGVIGHYRLVFGRVGNATEPPCLSAVAAIYSRCFP